MFGYYSTWRTIERQNEANNRKKMYVVKKHRPPGRNGQGGLHIVVGVCNKVQRIY